MITEFSKGSTILVDKPLYWTSFDVVNKIRWCLKKKLDIKKIKVGHAGTLDPLATGLLVICIGEHTKRINKLMAGVKAYTGKFLLGKTTPSYDLEMDFDAEFPTAHITDSLIEEVRAKFIGENEQTPPVFSAKKIKGKRAYDIARSGKAVVLDPSYIKINSMSIDATKFPEIGFEVTCSKGTYIRTLASDFGKRLDSGATLIELRRIRSGGQLLEESKSVLEWIEIIQNSPL
jgi:tRNA pseudouridine55 synthase